MSRISGQRWEVPDSCRIVNAHYLAPSIPAESSPPFAVADDARVVTVNDVVRMEEAPSQYVVVGSGKTATDACVWLLGQGVDPGAICWVRPREPWMLNRALIQPDPAVYLGVPATMFEAAVASSSLDEVFLRLEEAGVMMRIDRSLTPTMAKSPTLGAWELELLRSIEDVVRHGHLRSVSRGLLDLRRRHVGAGRRRRGGRALRGRRTEEPAARADLGAPRTSPSSRCARASRASPPPSPATSRRPGATTTRRTGSARPRASATRSPSGRR